MTFAVYIFICLSFYLPVFFYLSRYSCVCTYLLICLFAFQNIFLSFIHLSVIQSVSLSTYYYYKQSFFLLLNSPSFDFQITPTTFRPGFSTTVRPGFPTTIRPGFPTTSRPGFSTVSQIPFFLYCWFPEDTFIYIFFCSLTTQLSIYLYVSVCLSVY